MDIELVEKLLQLLSTSNADEIEIEEEGRRIKVAKHRNSFPNVHDYPVPPPGYPVQTASQPPSKEAPPAASAVTYHEIRSPIVGTFYKAPAPDAAPFVEPGSVVQPGTLLCIVEAMKLMNEIESDIHGKIVKVMVDNGQPVEYDQVLFLVEKL